MADPEELSNFPDLRNIDGTPLDRNDRMMLRNLRGLEDPPPGDGMKRMLEENGYKPDLEGFLEFRIAVHWPSQIRLGNLNLYEADPNKMSNTDFVFATALHLMSRNARILRGEHATNIENMLANLQDMDEQV